MGINKVLGNHEEDDVAAAFICLFCCQEIISREEGSLGEDDEKEWTAGTQVLQRFFKLVGRDIGFDSSCWMGTDSPIGRSSSSLSPPVMGRLIRSCDNCLQIVSIYCDLHHQLKSVELRLNWQIDKLWQVMRCANRETSRLKMFKKWCRVKATSNLAHSYCSTEKKNLVVREVVTMGNTTSTDATSKTGQRLDLYEFRSDFKRKCNGKRYKSKMLPRVSLNRKDVTCLNLQNLDKNNLTKRRANTCSVTKVSNPPPIATGITSAAAPSMEDASGSGLVSTPCQFTPSTLSEAVGEYQRAVERKGDCEADMASVSSNFEDDLLDDMMDMEEDVFNWPAVECPSSDPLSSPLVNEECEKMESDPCCNFEGDRADEMVVDEEEPFIHLVDHRIQSVKTATVKQQKMKDRKLDNSGDKFQTKEGSNSEDNEWRRLQSEDSETTTDDEEEEDDEHMTEFHQFKKNTCSLPPKVECNKSKEKTEMSYSKRKRCRKCTPYKTFSDHHALRQHYSYHHSNGQLSVFLDARGRLPVRDLIREHVYPCQEDNCDRFFLYPNELEYHCKLYHSTDNPFSCHCCSTFTSPSVLALISHELKHKMPDEEELQMGKGNTQTCARCAMEAGSKEEIVSHYLENHLGLPPAQFSCSICSTSFKGREQVPLLHFINWHDRNRLTEPTHAYQCNEKPDCSAYFLRKEQLERHKRMVHSEQNEGASEGNDQVRGEYGRLKYGQYVCTKCVAPRQFRRQIGLELHQLYMHSNGKVTMTGDKIGKQVYMTDLKLEGFPSKSRHHPCPTPGCGKTFFHEEELVGHTKLHHNKENLYHCQDCKVFTTCSALELIDHELQHTEEKQKEMEKEEFRPGVKFVCGRCSNVVKQGKMEVINHYLEVHLNSSPLQVSCPICQETFGREKVPLIHYINYHDLHRLEDPDTSFRCKDSQCSAYFLTEEQLHLHWNRVHPYMGSVENNISRMKAVTKKKIKIKRNKCPQCPRTFLSQHQLTSHLWKHHDDDLEATDKKRYYKKINMVISLPEDGLTIRDIMYDTKAKFYCEVTNCGKGFMEEADLTTHSKLHGEFQCGICPVVKPCATELAIHEMVHRMDSARGSTKDKAYCCSRCDYTIGTRGLYWEHFLEEHLKLIPDKKRCPICRLQYRYVLGTNNQLMIHSMWRHYMEYHRVVETETNDRSEQQDPGKPQDKLYHCERVDCSAYFLQPTQVREHVLEVHENISKKDQLKNSLKCEDCGKQFQKQYQLRNHRRITHKTLEENFKFLCTFSDCGRRFERKIEFENHIAYAHLRSEQLECPVENCDKKFWNQLALRSHHQRVHEGKVKTKTSTSVVCDECGKSFRNNGKLNAHRIRHADPETWKFECSVCKKKFVSRTDLNMHIRVHSNERPFVCDICGVTYAHPSSLREHWKSKHGPPQEIKRRSRKRKGVLLTPS